MLYLCNVKVKQEVKFKPYGNTVKPLYMTQFEVGKRYGMRSICDSDCWWYYTVIERTACTVTLKSDRGEVIKCRINKAISAIHGAEACRPLGTYSMCPTLTAEKVIENNPEPKFREEVRKQGTTPDGREVKVVERYDDMAVNQGCFLIIDGEETEYTFLGTAITMFNDLVRPVNPDEPKAMKSFAIYQLPASNNATFMDYEFVTENNIMPKLEDYKMIYRGEVSKDATLDDLFRIFNVGIRPADYKGRSLSVSDVVLMDGQFSYCDSYGWQPVNL